MKKTLLISLILFLTIASVFSQIKASGDIYWSDEFITANAPDDTVRAVCAYNSNFVAAGDFINAGGVNVNNIALYDGTSWSSMGTGMDGDVYCVVTDGSNIYAGGEFITAGGVTANYIAVWDGSAWSSLGTGMDAPVYSLCFNEGYLYAGGDFTMAGGTSANSIAVWDGSAWSAFGSGLNSTVHAISVDGTNIYAGGSFSDAGGIANADNIAYWDGAAWNALGTGTDGTVYDIHAQGGSLYACGSFVNAGGVTVNNIAKWSGAWYAMGTGTDNVVYTLDINPVDQYIYIGGAFSLINGVSVSNVARYNRISWDGIGSGLDDICLSLDIDAYELYCGGSFRNAGINQSDYTAKLFSSPVIIDQPVDIDACIYDTVTFTIHVDGTKPFNYQWTFDGSDISGATDSALTINNIIPSDAGNYKCKVWNSVDTVTSVAASLFVHESPQIILNPTDDAICLNDPTNMKVSVNSTQTLTYQWFLNSTAISGGTSSTYNIPNASPSDTGTYFCIVTTTCGSDTSTTAHLTVYPLPVVSFSDLIQLIVLMILSIL